MSEENKEWRVTDVTAPGCVWFGGKLHRLYIPLSAIKSYAEEIAQQICDAHNSQIVANQSLRLAVENEIRELEKLAANNEQEAEKYYPHAGQKKAHLAVAQAHQNTANRLHKILNLEKKEVRWKDKLREQEYKKCVERMDSPSDRNWNRSPFSFGSNSGTA